MDGNRRFAKRLMLKPWKGHEWGAKKLHSVLNWCKDLGVDELTVYAFSYENFNRPEDEKKFLFEIFNKEFQDLINKQDELKSEGLKVNFIGRLNMFPEQITSKMNKLMEVTKENNNIILNVAMAYGGRVEVIDAVRKIAKQVDEGKLNIDQINEDTFEKQLYMTNEPELIIRTGGEQRTSNFLIWQSSYSEWIFLDKKWPEFEKADFEQCLENYAQRSRRFGK